MLTAVSPILARCLTCNILSKYLLDELPKVLFSAKSVHGPPLRSLRVWYKETNPDINRHIRWKRSCVTGKELIKILEPEVEVSTARRVVNYSTEFVMFGFIFSEWTLNIQGLSVCISGRGTSRTTQGSKKQ